MRLHRPTSALALLLSVTGCATADWAMTEENLLAEAILETAPFNAPASIEVDYRVATSCQEVTGKRSPAAWVGLTESRLATMKPDGDSGCVLIPAGQSAKAGGQMEWKLASRGSRWRVPVGIYSIEGTNDDPAMMDRSLAGPNEVRFSWRFGLFRRLEKVAGARAVASATGHKGNAVAKFDRTAEGWRVSSISLGSPP